MLVSSGTPSKSLKNLKGPLRNPKRKNCKKKPAEEGASTDHAEWFGGPWGGPASGLCFETSRTAGVENSKEGAPTLNVQGAQTLRVHEPCEHPRLIATIEKEHVLKSLQSLSFGRHRGVLLWTLHEHWDVLGIQS